ncbi:MAG: GDP-mannose 4,6-dehydratase [Verrucomicrobiia bacterium]|jgi:GDPmannose 4,6-dehydratase
MPRALITGITGQDGSYLTELLLKQGYQVHGVVRRTSSLDRSRLHDLYQNPEVYGKSLFLHYAELDDATTFRRVLATAAPDEVYHLAGQSHVGLSFEIPESTCKMTGMATLRMLEMIQDLDKVPRFFHAASSEIFGKPVEIPQDENTPCKPVNPYGASKAFATNMVGIYRDTFGVFGVNGIMFNHESPRRGENFVTQKVCRAAAAIKLGKQDELLLGDTSAKRDWGHALDYVRGMWLSLQHATAEDYIFATGHLHSVQDVVETAFKTVNLDSEKYIRQDQRFMRPAEPQRLVGNPSKAKRLLNWEPTISFHELIEEMTQAEMKRLQGGKVEA